MIHPTDSGTDNRRRSIGDRLENWLKIITPLGAIAVFAAGIYQYKDTQHEEFRRIYWESRLEVYRELVTATSTVVNTPDSTARERAVQDFWEIYWGHIVLVEDRHVYEAMRSFGASLERAVYPDSLPALRLKSLHVGQACRLSLQETWAPIPASLIRSINE